MTSEPTTARGDPGCPLTDDEVMRKFDSLAALLDPERREAIKDAVRRFGSGEPTLVERLSELILAPLLRG